MANIFIEQRKTPKVGAKSGEEIPTSEINVHEELILHNFEVNPSQTRTGTSFCLSRIRPVICKD